MTNRKYLTILADPPWAQSLTGRRKRYKGGAAPELPYQTMTLNEIKAMPIGELASDGSHLWLWTTNEFIRHGFDVMDSWGFRYLAPIHWVKPSGIGNWFVHRTQTLLFGYRGKCRFDKARYLPNLIHAGNPRRHSEKPEESYRYIESVSVGPRLELFARKRRQGWDSWGNEVVSDIQFSQYHRG